MNQNSAVLTRAIEACTHGQVDVMSELFTADVSAWSPTMLASGLPALVESMSEVDTALSDVDVQVDAVDAFGNKAVAEYRITGRFTGSFTIEDVVVEPNGHLVVIGAVIVAEFDGSKIKAFRNYFDELSLIEQLVAPV